MGNQERRYSGKVSYHQSQDANVIVARGRSDCASDIGLSSLARTLQSLKSFERLRWSDSRHGFRKNVEDGTAP
jgi:hypothetical protein